MANEGRNTPVDDEMETGGTLAGEDVEGGSILRGGTGEFIQKQPHSWDNEGRLIETEPEFTGTIAGDTSSAGATVAKNEEKPPHEVGEELTS